MTRRQPISGGGAGRGSAMAQAVIAAGMYFGVVFSLGFLLGILRTVLIAPVTGELVAVALELPVVVAGSWIVCGWALRRLSVPAADTGSRLAMGSLALALLMGAEAIVSVLIGGRSLAEHLALYRTAPVLLGLCGQLLYAAFPLLRLRSTKRDSD